MTKKNDAIVNALVEKAVNEAAEKGCTFLLEELRQAGAEIPDIPGYKDVFYQIKVTMHESFPKDKLDAVMSNINDDLGDWLAGAEYGVSVDSNKTIFLDYGIEGVE